MKTNKRYEVLLLDADGTLLDFDRAEAESFKAVLKKYGFPQTETLAEEYHKINKECWEAFEEGKIDRETVLTSRFERFFKGHGLTVDGREAENYYRSFLGRGFYLIDGALEICSYLKKRYALYIVTNGVADTQHIRLRESGLEPYFKDVFISEEAGSQKPKKEFFDYCFARIPGAEPEKMLLIGDSLTSDMRGGVNAGVDTCWYNPSRRKNDKGVCVTYEIQDLIQLEELL